MNAPWGETPRLKPGFESFELLVLDFVREYIAGHRASPSYGEIANGIGSNRERVRTAIRALERKGMIRRGGGPRSLSLPGQREEAIRLLREAGWTVDEDVRAASPPLTNRPLPAPVRVEYLPQITDRGSSGGKGTGQASARRGAGQDPAGMGKKASGPRGRGARAAQGPARRASGA